MGDHDDWNDDPEVWIVRAPNGTRWKPASLTQIAAALADRTFTEDMEVSHVGSSLWVSMRAIMERLRQPSASKPEVAVPAEPRLQGEPTASSDSTRERARIGREVPRGGPMPWIDRIEKIGRVILWLSIASACVIAPIEYVRLHKTEVELREAARQADEELKAAEKAEKAAHEPHRLAFASMRAHFMSALVPSAPGEQGKVWFTNVSPRTGIVCVYGVATSHTTKRESTSLPTCTSIAAYAAPVHLSLMFAGGDLLDVCPKQGDCDLTIEDAPEAKEVPLAAQ
jgi:hypothetical protein